MMFTRKQFERINRTIRYGLYYADISPAEHLAEVREAILTDDISKDGLARLLRQIFNSNHKKEYGDKNFWTNLATDIYQKLENSKETE